MSVACGPDVSGDSARNARSFFWRYLLLISGRALYVGASPDVADALRAHYKSLDWRNESRHTFDAFVGNNSRFDVIVVDWPAAYRWLVSGSVDTAISHLAGLVSDSGILVVRFEKRAVYEQIWPRRDHSSATELMASVSKAGLSDDGLFWFRDGFNPASLYGVSRLGNSGRPASQVLSPFAWHMRRRSLALVARRSRFDASGCPRIEAGHLVTRESVEPVASAWIGSGSVHRVETSETIVRIPFDERAVDRCRNNHTTLQTLAGLQLSFMIPQAKDTFAYGGLPCYAESRVPGLSTDLRALSPRSSHVRVESVTRALVDMQRATRLAVTIDEKWLTDLVHAPCARLSPSLPRDLRHALSDLEMRLGSILMNRPFSLVQLHGDFKGSNLLWSEDQRISAVVDWDLAVRYSFPVIDFAFYNAYEHAVQSRAAFDVALADQVEPTSGAYWQFAEHELGLTKTTYAFCVLMGLVRYGTFHAGFLDASEHPQWCERYVNSGLRRVCDHIARMVRSTP
jgi:hypothetical protein